MVVIKYNVIKIGNNEEIDTKNMSFVRILTTTTN